MPRVPASRNKTRTFVAFAHAVVAHRRLPMNDWLLATMLAGVAGAVNAGGFFVVAQYTSHMTGYLSQIADNLIIGQFSIVMASGAAILAFLFGAAASAFLVNWARQGYFHQQYALPIAVQGFCLFLFSFAGYGAAYLPVLILLLVLCVLMGMQNATITKLSKARIRTTHVTGMITDIGIELGKAMFKFSSKRPNVKADPNKLSILLSLVFSYLIGGVVGAVGFGNFGFMFAMPLAFVLLTLSLPTLLLRRKRL